MKLLNSEYQNLSNGQILNNAEFISKKPQVLGYLDKINESREKEIEKLKTEDEESRRN